MVQCTIDRRAILFAEYMLEHKATIRATAESFGFSKSTVHKDVSIRLKDIDAGLYSEVCLLLNDNLKDRHIRGGKATKQKYTEMRNGRNT